MDSKLKKIIQNISEQIDKIYLLQLRSGVLYPNTISKSVIRRYYPKEELERPYLVHKFESGNAVSIPYHVFFKKELLIIKNNSHRLSRLLADDKYLKYSNYLFKGEYSKMEELWLTSQDSEYNFSIGPLLGYHDKLFGTKKYYSFCFIKRSVTNENELNNYSCLAIEELNDYFSSNIDSKNYQVLSGSILNWSGEIKDMRPIAWARPNGSESTKLIKKYGAKSLYFENTLQVRSKKGFAQLKKQNLLLRDYTLEDNIKYLPVSTLLHEIGHIFLVDPKAEDRAGECYRFVDELKADSIALVSARRDMGAQLRGRLARRHHRPVHVA